MIQLKLRCPEFAVMIVLASITSQDRGGVWIILRFILKTVVIEKGLINECSVNGSLVANVTERGHQGLDG
jgi:hypothetical protein